MKTTTAPTLIIVEMPEPFHLGWNRIGGVTVDGLALTIDPSQYFIRFEQPVWLICDWSSVVRSLLGGDAETSDLAAEQRALNHVREFGRRVTSAAEVLHTAADVYGYVFADQQLDDDPSLGSIATPAQLRMLREASILMALNRVDQDGHIANVSPVWMAAAACRVAYELDDTETAALDELYHGTWFNEHRRLRSVLAHAALGGRLVHGCQEVGNMSGGCVVEYGTDTERMRRELACARTTWLDMLE